MWFANLFLPFLVARISLMTHALFHILLKLYYYWNPLRGITEKPVKAAHNKRNARGKVKRVTMFASLKWSGCLLVPMV